MAGPLGGMFWARRCSSAILGSRAAAVLRKMCSVLRCPRYDLMAVLGRTSLAARCPRWFGAGVSLSRTVPGVMMLGVRWWRDESLVALSALVLKGCVGTEVLTVRHLVV